MRSLLLIALLPTVAAADPPVWRRNPGNREAVPERGGVAVRRPVEPIKPVDPVVGFGLKPAPAAPAAPQKAERDDDWVKAYIRAKRLYARQKALSRYNARLNSRWQHQQRVNRSWRRYR